MGKTYVLDTSVLIHDPHSIETFEDSQVIIPLTVLSELDVLKAGQNQTAHAAREASRIIDSIREAGMKLTDFSPLGDTGIRIKVMNYSKDVDLPAEIDLGVKDNQIIATALTAKKEAPDDTIILVSKDTVLRITAESVGVTAEDYKKDKVSSSYVFSNVAVKVSLIQEEYDQLVKNGVLVNRRFETIKNHSLIETDFGSPKRSIIVKQPIGKGSAQEHQLKVINMKDLKPWKLTARNIQQLYALYLLMEPDVKILTISGITGSGKTILAMAAGLEQITELKRYKRLVVMRPMVPVGEDVGFLKGDLDDKMAPWVEPIKDNVEALLGDEESGTESKSDYLFDSKTIVMQPITFIRGRTINNSFIYIDEAQNMTISTLKAAIGRAGSKSKVIVAGDVDQIDKYTLDKYSCGVAVAAERLKPDPNTGHAILTKAERSKIAELAATLL